MSHADDPTGQGPNPVPPRPIRLIDGLAGSPQEVVPASLVCDLPPDRLPDIEQAWSPARQAVSTHLLALGRPAEHAHWNWRNKSNPDRHRIFAVECAGGVQGLMAVLRKPRPAGIAAAPGPVVYVDFIEVAPWNLKSGPNPPRYRGVGTVLIAEAIRLSQEMGLCGRVGLHALPQAEDYYLSHCRMTWVGRDDRYYDLAYFEYTEQQAAEWLAESGT
ncbi:MAG TPA: hypothetical protein VFG68_04220 [Fimbriiglobus sp.]|nr:hypothetical protein [Fimbriiglobus sp.]